jgi:hypothetical protein
MLNTERIGDFLDTMSLQIDRAYMSIANDPFVIDGDLYNYRLRGVGYDEVQIVTDQNLVRNIEWPVWVSDLGSLMRGDLGYSFHTNFNGNKYQVFVNNGEDRSGHNISYPQFLEMQPDESGFYADLSQIQGLDETDFNSMHAYEGQTLTREYAKDKRDLEPKWKDMLAHLPEIVDVFDASKIDPQE